jgi:exopolysaccharide production protein ExoZ
MLQSLRPDASSQARAKGRENEVASTIVTVQYLRAIAAMLVVFHHAMAPPALHPYYPRPFGEFGVDLFFVISGFIMWTTTVGARRGPASFWAARILRIVPLYWIYTTLFVAIALILPRALFTTPGLDLSFIIKSYLFVPALHPHFGGIAPVYTLGWTLNYEMFFYFVFGVGLLIARPNVRMAALVAVFVLLVSIGLLAEPQGPVLATYTNPILLEFLAGIVLARLAPWLMHCPRLLGVVLIGLGAFWLGHVVTSDTPPSRIAGYGVSAIAIVAGALVLEPIARVTTNRLGLLLGDASYSIYLAHPFAQRVWFLAIGRLLPDISVPFGLLVHVMGAMLVGIAGGVCSYLLIERPLLVAGRRLIGLRRRRYAEDASKSR